MTRRNKKCSFTHDLKTVTDAGNSILAGSGPRRRSRRRPHGSASQYIDLQRSCFRYSAQGFRLRESSWTVSRGRDQRGRDTAHLQRRITRLNIATVWICFKSRAFFFLSNEVWPRGCFLVSAQSISAVNPSKCQISKYDILPVNAV